MALQISIDTTQKEMLHGQPLNAKKGAAPINGIQTWSVDVPGIVSLFPSDDGTSCEVVALAVGNCTVTSVGNSSFAPGSVVPVTGSVPVTVTAAPATSILITADPVVQQ